MDNKELNIEKIEQLEQLLETIKNKSDHLSSQTKQLRILNTRLSLLLKCFESYSIHEDECIVRNEIKKQKIAEGMGSTIGIIKSDQKVLKKNEEISVSNNENNQNSHNNQDNQNNNVIICKNDDKKVPLSPSNAVNNIFNGNPISRNIANSIIDLIKARESISLDDLVKSIKSSKYKVIEVLNMLIKERIITKSFDKGFIYRISKDRL